MKNNISKYKVDILAFGAHPDDVEAGAGGTVVKMAKKGYKIAIVDLSQAELSTNGNVTERLKEADEARKILGVKYRENLKFPNNFFLNSKKVQDKLVRVIRKYQPEIVFLPYYLDRHPDHENSSKLIREALFTSGLVKYETGQQKWRPKYVFFYMLWYEFQPTLLVDISNEWKTKVKAIFAYKSQFALEKGRKPTIDNDNNTIKFFEARDRNNGFWIGKTYAEPFLSLTPIGVNYPSEILPNFF